MAFSSTIQHVTAGPTKVQYSLNADHTTLSDLGYTQDGVEITIIPRYQDIQSDDFGGSGGVPSDSQFLGATADVRAQLVKFNDTNVQKMTSFYCAGSAGVLPQFGTFIKQPTPWTGASTTINGLYGKLYLLAKHETISFAVAFVRQAIQTNKGTRFSQFNLGFECWVDSNLDSYRNLFTRAEGAHTFTAL